jgi:hypothetical protein
MKPLVVDSFFPDLADDLSILEVMIVHEDDSTRLRAINFFHRLVHHLHFTEEFPPQIWRFDRLRNPAMRQRATRVAADSDIIILSAHARNEFPTEVQTWLNDWLREKENRPCSLIALLDNNAVDLQTQRSLISRLRTLTRKAGVEFFYWMFHQPASPLTDRVVPLHTAFVATRK